MILAATDDSVSDMHLENVLQNVFNVLVLNVGLNEITNTKNIDVLKKEFRVGATFTFIFLKGNWFACKCDVKTDNFQLCYPIIDILLQGIKPTENTLYFSDLTMCADVALQIESTVNYQVKKCTH